MCHKAPGKFPELPADGLICCNVQEVDGRVWAHMNAAIDRFNPGRGGVHGSGMELTSEGQGVGFDGVARGHVPPLEGGVVRRLPVRAESRVAEGVVTL